MIRDFLHKILFYFKHFSRFSSETVRNFDKTAAKDLKPGSAHYTAFVGPPSQYDYMGASQFNLLCALGLRENHKLLDFGCGSLRAGRLFIPYLNSGNYYGIEPNVWLIEDAIEREIGKDLIKIKRPFFSNDDSGNCLNIPDKIFDYILAQSIFSHTGKDLLFRIWMSFKRKIKNRGIVVATFIHTNEGESEFAGSGWIYPHCVRYHPSSIKCFLGELGFYCQRLPWYHPRQTWYLSVLSPDLLIPKTKLHLLNGAVFFNKELADSLQQ